MKTYKEAREWLEDRKKFGIHPGLERMTMLMEGLGNPERKMKSVHIGGTNGKGSTTAFLRNILEESGMEVGTFTSPYIDTFRERVSVNGKPISEDDFLEAANAVRPIVESVEKSLFGPPTEFEIITAIAARCFSSKAFPDVVIWEVGLGGRLDSTNVMLPLISVITNIGHDHQHILGSTIEEITREKAGIVKSGVPLITCEEKPASLEILEEAVSEKFTKMYQLGRDFHIEGVEAHEEGITFSFQSLFLKKLDRVKLSMMGPHQAKNAAAAVMAARYLKMYYAFPAEDSEILRGLEKTSWPGRLEINREKRMIIDGAHNKEGMASLIEALQAHFSNNTFHFIIGTTKEKNINDFLDPLQSLNTATVSLAGFDFERAADPKTLDMDDLSGQPKVYTDWKQAVEEVETRRTDGEWLVLTGSLYFISDIRKTWKP